MLKERHHKGTDPNLRWFHPQPDERYHELQLPDGEKLASIRWLSGHETLANGQWGADIWGFRRYGFLHPKITINPTEGTGPSGRFEPNMSGGGILQLKDGQEFRLFGNFWRGEWRWADAAGHDVLEFKRDFAVMEKNEGHLTWLSDETLPVISHLLILLGWYVVILMAEDAAHPPE
ncbi:MAG: hypothetical protein ABR524_04105 [Thermoanaerobaculia bacterium]